MTHSSLSRIGKQTLTYRGGAQTIKAALGIAAICCVASVSAQRTPSPSTADVAAGKQIFESKGGCAACHALDNSNGTLGPTLGWIGLLRTPASLRQSLTTPDADIHPRFLTIVIQTDAGQTFEGLLLNEDDLSIQIRDAAHQNRSFLKSRVKIRRDERSMMPSYAERLSPIEIDQVVAYLRTLRTLWPLQSGVREREAGGVSENIAFFDRPERADVERTGDLIKALEIPKGARIADIGAGTGFFTWRLAEQAGAEGKVFAVDIQQKMLDLAAAAVRQHQLANVEFTLATESDPRLPDRSLDMVFIAHSYHEFADPEVVMAAVKRSLKPDGRLVVVEYAKENRDAPASSLHKMSFDEMRGEIEPLGFELDRILDFLPVQHALIFTVRK